MVLVVGDDSFLLSFFTDPYEDELLYNTIARYHYYCGNVNFKDTLCEIFGVESVIPSIEFPSRLSYLAKQIERSSKYDSVYLINKHTLYPFHSPFLIIERKEKILNEMKCGNGKGIYTKIGTAAGGICRKEGLYYCSICVQEDLDRCGEPYFHRIHQLQGVFACPDHYCKVIQYPVSKKEASRISFIRLEADKVNLQSEYLNNTKVADMLINVAKSAMYLLQKDLSAYNLQLVLEKYIKQLNNRGFITCNGTIKQENLCKEFVGYFGLDTLKILESEVDPEDQHNWLSTLFRKSQKATHPIRHILLILFLCGSMEAFFENEIICSKPFGEGPWPCLNPVAGHYKKDIVISCTITSDYKTRQPVGTFRCSCGFVYSRKGPDINSDDRYRIGRIKEFGDNWMCRLAKLLKENTHGIRELGRLMGCDPKTVVKQAQQNGLGNYVDSMMTFYNKTASAVNMPDDKRKQYENEILELIKTEPELTKTQIRKRLKKQYAWFYRNNRTWLDKNLPKATPVEERYKGANDTRVDWMERDLILLQQIKGIHEELLQEDKPARITKSLIERKLGKSALLRFYSDKLPKTKALMDDIIETIEQFQIRRVYRVCDKLYEEKGTLRKWKIVRLAGLRSGYSSKVDEMINENIEKYTM